MPVSQFKKDIVDLFNRVRGGHVDHWLYSDAMRNGMSGSQLWHTFLRASKNYYILPNEIELISNISSELEHLSHIDTLIDFGVGDEIATVNKTMPIIKGLGNVNLYIGIDTSKDFVDASCKRLANDLSIRTKAIQDNFYKQSNITLSGDNRLGVMFGSTITNQDMKEGDEFPRQEIVSKIRNIKQIIGSDNHMLITYDANSDRDSVMKAYDNIFWSRHVTGLMYDVAPLTKGEFSVSGWVHKRIWRNDIPVIHQCVEATEDQEFIIDKHFFRIRKGDRFVAVNNFKYSVQLFQSLCLEAGFEIGKHYTDDQKRICIQELHA